MPSRETRIEASLGAQSTIGPASHRIRDRARGRRRPIRFVPKAAVVVATLCVLLSYPRAARGAAVVALDLGRDNLARYATVAGERLWLATEARPPGKEKGVCRADGSSAERIPCGPLLRVAKPFATGHQAWVQTDTAVYGAADGGRLEQVRGIGPGERIRGMGNAGDQAWVATNRTIYRVDSTYQADPTSGIELYPNDAGEPDSGLQVGSIRDIGGKPWVVADHAVYRVDGTQAVRIMELDRVREFVDIQYVGGTVWLATRSHVYRLRESLAPVEVPVSAEGGRITALRQSGDHAWVVADKAAYRVRDEAGTPGVERVSGISRYGETVLGVEEDQNGTWVATNQAIYLVSPNAKDSLAAQHVLDLDPAELPPVSHRPQNWPFQKIGEDLWVTAPRAVYRVEGGALRPVQHIGQDPRETIAGVAGASGGAIWVVTNVAVYYVSHTSAEPVCGFRGAGSSLYGGNGRVWLLTGGGGAYYLDEKLSMSVEFFSSSGWYRALDAVLPGRYWVGEVNARVRYAKDGKSVEQPPGDFVLAAGFDASAQERTGGRAPDELGLKLPGFGSHVIYYKVSDRSPGRTYGNIRIGSVKGTALPAPGVASAYTLLFYVVLLAIAIVLAPYSEPVHRLLMNPFARNYLSLGMVPLVLSLALRARNHILLRYMSNLLKHDEFSRWQEGLASAPRDLLPEGLHDLLHAHDHALVVVGGVPAQATRYLTALTGCYAARTGGPPRKEYLVPIYMPLDRYQGQGPLEVYRTELERLGEIEDPALADWFLKQGGFLMLIDGLDSVDQQARQAVSAFVQQYRERNYFCLWAREQHPEFGWIGRKALANGL